LASKTMEEEQLLLPDGAASPTSSTAAGGAGTLCRFLSPELRAATRDYLGFFRRLHARGGAYGNPIACVAATSPRAPRQVGSSRRRCRAPDARRRAADVVSTRAAVGASGMTAERWSQLLADSVLRGCPARRPTRQKCRGLGGDAEDEAELSWNGPDRQVHRQIEAH
jgi:hypothetical protein